MTLQSDVYVAVKARGYIPCPHSVGWLIGKQLVKAMEELGEVARHVFDGVEMPPAHEIADVIIPLLVMSEELGYDIEQAIRDKVNGDVARGVR